MSVHSFKYVCLVVFTFLDNLVFSLAAHHEPMKSSVRTWYQFGQLWVAVYEISFTSMADDTGKRSEIPKSLPISFPLNETPNSSHSGERLFSPDSARRQRFFAEPKFSSVNGQVITAKKHDVFQTLQETLGVLKDEAVVSRDSHKKEGLWCHPFEIPRHPIEQIELKNEEIAQERQQSKLIEKLTPDGFTEMEEVVKKDIAESMAQSCERIPFYQRLAISGGDISGVYT